MLGRQVVRCVGGMRKMRGFHHHKMVLPTTSFLPTSSLPLISSTDKKRMFRTAMSGEKEERETMWQVALAGGVIAAGIGALLGKKEVFADELDFLSPGAGEEMYHRVDTLYEQEKYDEAITILQELIDLVPDNNDALWRLARTLCGKSEVTQSNSEKKQLLERAIEAGNLSLEAEETYEAHKWLGAALFLAASCYWWPGWMSTMEKAKIHLEQAAQKEEEQYQSSTCQIETKLLWGKWNYEAEAGNTSFWHLMSYLSWSNVPKGDLDTALTCFLEVEGAMVQHNKFEMEATLYLVKTYLALGDKEKAEFWLKQGGRRKMKRGHDAFVHQKMERMRV